MGTCASLDAFEEVYKESARFEPSPERKNSDLSLISATTASACTSHTQSRSGASRTSLTTVVDFSLFKKQKTEEEYQVTIGKDGKLGAVREFIQGNESAAICWCAFASGEEYMSNEQIYEFFEFCLLYVSQSTDASMRCAFFHLQPGEMYQRFVVGVFNKLKAHFNQREFWCVADRLHAEFHIEKASSESADEPLDIGYHRKQVLVKAFYLCEPEELERMDGVIFKLFSMKQRGILMIEEFRQLVYHSIIFFSQKDEHELECSGDFDRVISEVVWDVLEGELDLKEMCLDRFRMASKELKDVFHKLIVRWKKREAERLQELEHTYDSVERDATPDPEQGWRKATWSVGSGLSSQRSEPISVHLNYAQEEEV